MSQHSAQQQQDDDLQSEHHSDSPPPQPLLRPAQGAWSAYNFSQLRKATTVTRGDGSSLSSSRLTRPESAERHSQGGLAKASTRNVVEHPMTNATRRQSPNPSSRPYNPNYYPNAAYTQPPLNTQLHNKNNTSYYRSTVSPSSSRERERERDSDHISQSQQQSSRNNHEERELPQQQQQQNTSSHHHYHHHHRLYRHSPSPPTFSREDSHSPLGNPGPRNQSPSSPTTTPAPTTVHSGTSISQIIAATQPGPVVRDSGGGHFQTSQHQRQHSKSPPISSSARPSGSDPNHKSGSFRPKPASHSNSSTGMYPFNSLSVTAGVPETGISGNNNANDNSSSNPASSSIPDPNAAEAYTNPAISSAPPNMTSPLLAYPSVPDHQTHPHPHMGIAQTLTPSLTPALPPVQTQQAQPPPPQGHTQTQTLTPTITPTSALPPPPSHNVQHQAHSSPPSTSAQEIIVLLMEDIRFTGSEDPDFQLAEVSVSLREGSSSGGSGEGSSGPWWADGEEVIKALQMTTGRLEGAAKVYARRGKYRQCFVRISEDGVMECQPSSLLMVSREKTIELIIEPNFESRPTHDPYSYHRSHTPHHPPHPHPVVYPLHPHPHSRSTPSRMGMNINMVPGAGSSGGVAMSYDDYYGSPTSTSMAHSHPHPHLHSGPPYTTHMGGPPQYYSGSGNGGGTSPTFGQKRGHEDDTIPNKRLRTGSSGNGNNNTTSGGNGPSAGGGSAGGSMTNSGVNSVVMDMNTVSAMAAASNSTTSTGQSGSSTVPVEGVNPGPSAGGGGGPSNNSSNTGNTLNPSSSNRNRASIGMGLSRPGSRGGLRGNTSSPGNPGSITNNGGNNNNSGLSSNPLSVSIGVRANAPLGLGNVAATATSGQLRGSTGTSASASTPVSASGSGTAGTGTPGPSAMTSGSGNHAQRPSSPEEYTPSSQVFPPNSGGRMNNPTFVNHQGGKAPKEIINAAIVAYLRSHIQNEEGYMEFAASKGRLLPIPELLRGYRFAARIVTTWANRKTPPTAEGCGNKRITKNHVLQALFRQTSWGSDCEQTLQLADKYGPGGPFEDSRVVEILNGGSMLPEKGSLGLGGANDGTSKAAPGRSQGSVALLDFLKDVDKDYKSRSGGGGGGGKKPPAQSVVASGSGETSSSRRTPIVTGNPYPSLSTSPISGADVVSGAVSNTSVPPNTNNTNNTASSSTSPPTQNPTPTVTPTTSPNLDHAISPNSVTGGVVGEVVQTQMESGSSSIIADASLAAATVAGIIASSAASTAVS
ncbi:hypothetical protein Clacol_000770 [Clathrus columnatus]|uniref:Uncharacterized protein n=1 Tax=Clathrus columnatus TaxID=1419009 RepID=A0AAV4ZZ87_9AGAM|nr:hypothetical protein Clacol_000770 [Clathrus columnatus]